METQVVHTDPRSEVHTSAGGAAGLFSERLDGGEVSVCHQAPDDDAKQCERATRHLAQGSVPPGTSRDGGDDHGVPQGAYGQPLDHRSLSHQARGRSCSHEAQTNTQEWATRHLCVQRESEGHAS